MFLVVGMALLALAGFALLAPLVLRGWVEHRYLGRIYSQSADSPPMPAAIVFGAGYWPTGRLSDALADRMDTAVILYRTGKVNKLLLTGDNRFLDYNEPARMAEYAMTQGVPREDLVLDYAGRRTYDSCYRARAIFGVERAVLVTQAFHLPRALYTCDRLGLEAVGVVADRHRYVYRNWYRLRELFALARAWLDLNLLRPLPVLGDPIPVDWTRRSEAVSWRQGSTVHTQGYRRT
jgi:SanA protein